MLSESDSWYFWPMCFAAIIAGASCGDMVTACSLATDSIGGTRTFTATVINSQVIRTGTANLRTKRMKAGRSAAGALTRL
ncbi:Uncharacterised protein [Mycobacteroides abscessus subsp. abscessus]|nr:Uncharacterised protein [Mycobacteroides abscessus subsp. abscessus]SKU28540.1 Uncharacterised protein [Mycobacteroides abscessus subsp. abscessus]